MEKCDLCKELQNTEGGCQHYFEGVGHIFRCKECSMKNLRCIDCECAWKKESSLVLYEGNGEYVCFCKQCLDKSYLIFRILNQLSSEACIAAIKEGYKLVDDGYDEEMILECETKRNIAYSKEPQITEELKKSVLNGFDIIFAVDHKGVIIRGRDNCSEKIVFETDDYKYEFEIGCHNRQCNYITMFINISNDVTLNFKNNEVVLYINGDFYKIIPEWIPVLKLKEHCQTIINNLDIAKCEKTH